MDLFEHRYYRLSKILMMLIGQWPYQSMRVKRGILAVLFVLTGSELVPQILAFVKYRDNRTMLLECFTLYVVGTISFMKMVSFIVHSKKFEEDKCCIDLLLLWTVTMYLSFFVAMTQPLMPTIMEILLRNGTARREFPYPMVYYNIDEQKNYFYLVMYTNVCACLIMMVIVSSDVTLIMYVQHACGIFAAVGHKLKRIGNNDTSVTIEEKSYALSKTRIVDIALCVDRHNDAIEYANLIEASYTRIFFIVTGAGFLLLNGAGLQVLMSTSDPATTTRFIFYVLAIMFYFYIECYVSQILINHSKSIRFYIYNSQWYKLSPTIQKNLQFMMMRCTIPCQLTAGKLVILSVRTFMLTLKTCISFFGVFRTTQGL